MIPGQQGSLQFALYLPRMLLHWQAQDDALDYLEVDGTLVFADISGFTHLSEQLAAKGREGSEEVTRVLNGAFSEMLDVALLDGGDLLKFGGDALLHLFTGDEHAARAARSAFDMRDALEEFQDSSSPVPLSMSVGVASGSIEFLLAGGTNKELIVAGPTASDVVAMENAADSGEILLSRNTVDLIDEDVFGDDKGDGVLLDDAPDPDDYDAFADDSDDEIQDGEIDFDRYIPSGLRRHLTATFNEGEHRTANVAFVKLTGLDAVLADHGLEDATAMLDAVVAETQTIAERLGVTFLASDISEDGAKLILTTGVPARADAEEERILRAAREVALIDNPLDIAVGVARGSVFAGDLGSRIRRVYTVMGDTVNLAARLASAAAPNTALVTAKVLDRASSLFDTRQLEPMELKGKSKPIAPFELGDITSTGATAAAASLPIVGRDGELQILQDAVERAHHGKGNVVDLTGVAGIGKTRLMQALGEATAIRMLVTASEPYEASTAYQTAGRLVRAALSLPDDLGPEKLGELLDAAVHADAPALVPWMPFLARVIGAHVPLTPEVEAIDDAFQEEKTQEVVDQLLGAVLTEPVVMVLDAAEWVDDASRRTFFRIVADVEDRPWVVVVSRRPGDGWDDLEAGTTIELAGLDREAARDLVAVAMLDDPPPPTTVTAVIERAAGNPFFLLELLAGLSEDGDELPESIEAAAAERIDTLPLRDRRLLRYAAVLGTSFSLELLADALPEVASLVGDATVWGRLADFVQTTATGTVRFRQPILRDAAYAGLPYGRRRELHQSVGEALERRARRRPERFAEILSLHFEQAEGYDKAFEYAAMAAERARRKYATVVAADLYRRALRVGEKMDADLPPERDREIAEALGDMTDRAGLHEEAFEAYGRALDLASDDLDRGRILRKQGMVHEKLARYDEALEQLQQALDVLTVEHEGAERKRERLETMLGYAGVLNRKGSHEESVDWCRRVMDEAIEDDEQAVLAHSLNLLESNYTSLNHPDRGIHAQRALEIYHRSKDLVGEAKVLNNLGIDAYFLGDWNTALECWSRAGDAAEKAGDVVTAASAINNLAEIERDRGNLLEAQRNFHRALQMYRGARFRFGVAYARTNLGRTEVAAGNYHDADEHFDSAIAFYRDQASLGMELEATAGKLDGRVASGDVAGAVPLLDQAIEQAEEVPGSGIVLSRLLRTRGIARARLGDGAGAAADWDASLGLTRELKARFEEGLTLCVRSDWAQATGTDDSWGGQGQSILEDLGVESVPVVGFSVDT